MNEIINKVQNLRLKRLRGIFAKLSKEAYSIFELSLEFGVSTKTIKRDLEKLEASKIGNKWKILNKNVSENILQTLEQFNQSSLEDSVFVKFEAEKLSEDEYKNFKILEEAISNKKEICITFKGITFGIKPLKLALFDGFWYLLGLDSAKENKFKKFYFKDIENVVLKKECFSILPTLQKRIKEANNIWFDEECFNIRLFIEAPIVKYFLRKPLKSQKILGEDKDGSLEIEVQVSNEMEILPLIYSYIPYIKVLEPRSLQESIKKTLKAYLKEIK